MRMKHPHSLQVPVGLKKRGHCVQMSQRSFAISLRDFSLIISPNRWLECREARPRSASGSYPPVGSSIRNAQQRHLSCLNPYPPGGCPYSSGQRPVPCRRRSQSSESRCDAECYRHGTSCGRWNPKGIHRCRSGIGLNTRVERCSSCSHTHASHQGNPSVLAHPSALFR